MAQHFLLLNMKPVHIDDFKFKRYGKVTEVGRAP